jgi:hypothetical protein
MKSRCEKPYPHSLFFILPMMCGLIFMCSIAKAQTSISGIVNTYHKVIEIVPSKTCLRVGSTIGLGQTEKIMVVQMKGATVSTGNNASFGDTTSLNNAGNYEINTVCAIHGDSVFLFQDLVNNYTVADKLQIVGIPEYYDADVVDTLKASPWNNSTGTGGVLAIICMHNLILHAPVYADTTGYRGGSFLLSSGTCGNALPASAYFYNASFSNPQNGAYKGEGAYDIPVAQSGGRAAPANGGGGGNNHNNGGGGGANLTTGGIGGGNYSTIGCTTTLRGLAGKALSSWNGKKIFFGGGGGAGHANGGLVASWGGGNGGGIIFLQADNLIGNGQIVSANGGTGGPGLSDGASGGGAGGTIVMDIRYAYSGAVTISANGGSGGGVDQDGLSGRCYGSGGGGSGGALYFTSTVPAANIFVNGGAAGLESLPGGSCGTPALPGTGTNGMIIPNYAYTRSVNPAVTCAFLLPAKLIYFKAVAQQHSTWLKWQTASPFLVDKFIIERSFPNGDWEVIGELAGNQMQDLYQFIDHHPQEGIDRYRLRIVEQSGQFYYSSIATVSIVFEEPIVVFPNPAGNEINIRGRLLPDAMIRLIDLSGKIVYQKKITAGSSMIKIDTHTLPAGIYLLRVNQQTQKLVVY